MPVNSRLLYQLSYGSINPFIHRAKVLFLLNRLWILIRVSHRRIGMTPDNWNNCKILNCQPTRVNRNEQVLHVTFSYYGNDGSKGIASADLYVQDFAQLLQEQGMLHFLPSTGVQGQDQQNIRGVSPSTQFQQGRIRGSTKSQAA